MGDEGLIANRVGAVIEAAVAQRGQSVREFAREHDLDYWQPSKWTAGARVSLVRLARWAAALGVSPLALLEQAGYGGDGPSPRDRVAAALLEVPALSDDVRQLVLAKMEQDVPVSVTVPDGTPRGRRRV